MEKKLKVYIYREGNRPVFHQPNLKGIYASEGWFMKQMEANKQYVTNNPNKAHLFYFPFSSQMLQQTIYIPNSHTFDRLKQYLANYLDIIKNKYSFWNRTSGSDHFLVACHDWVRIFFFLPPRSVFSSFFLYISLLYEKSFFFCLYFY